MRMRKAILYIAVYEMRIKLPERAAKHRRSGGRQSFTFFVSYTADVAPSTPMVSRRLH